MQKENLSGITIMKMNEKLDAGPIYNQYSLKILENENCQELSSRLSNLASEKILENIDNILEGRAISKDQDHNRSTYAKKIKKDEGRIDWEDDSKNIIAKINGLYPSPGAWFMFKGERYKILRAESSILNGEPGIVLNENLEVACGKNSIRIIEIQRQGKKVQKAREFMSGSLISADSNLKKNV